MFETPTMALPMIDAAQAQKHVTVNEALVRLDAFASGRAVGFGGTVAPVDAADGDLHILGTGTTGAWAAADGRLALFLNGGWTFADPWAGLALWVDELAGIVRFDGISWHRDPVGTSPGGAATLGTVFEIDHAIAPGTTSVVAGAIPDKAIVLGVTARVTEAIAGPTGWSIGVAGAPDRYGAGFGTAIGAAAEGVTGQPQAYYGGTDLLLTAVGAPFAAGRVRIAVHALVLTPPL